MVATGLKATLVMSIPLEIPPWIPPDKLVWVVHQRCINHCGCPLSLAPAKPLRIRNPLRHL